MNDSNQLLPVDQTPPTATPYSAIANDNAPPSALLHSSFSNPRSNARRRVGYVARLPKPLRDEVNQMLLDGVPYGQIIRHVRPHGTNLTHNCLTNWKKGGHQDWLKEQRLIEECRLRQEFTLTLASQDQDANCFHTAHKITAALLCEALVECGSTTLRQAFQSNPLNLLRAVNSLSRITAGGLKCQRHLDEQAQRAVQSPPLPPLKKGLSKEALQELTQKLNLM